MSYFYIKKITVTGKHVEASSIDFENGLNIICGPSDTGKSYIAECLDYMFGSSSIRFDSTSGFDCFYLIISTTDGDITLERKLNSKKINVSSLNRLIESGEYSIGTGDDSIGYLWLKLINIYEPYKVISNSNYKKQKLTWRTFLHMFLIKESRVFQEKSIILPTQNTAQTAALSALLFLMTGKDYDDIDPREEKKIKEAKKNAVVNYINRSLANLAERKIELNEVSTNDVYFLQKKIDSILNELSEAEEQLSQAASRSKEMSREIIDTNEQLAECNMLHNRYQVLQSQYISDIKRLTFIVEGELHKGDLPLVEKCPFCNGNIPEQNEESYVDAAKVELQKILPKLQDLDDAKTDIVNERFDLQETIEELNKERSSIEILINSELKPRVASLRKVLVEYRRAIEVHNETHIIEHFEDTMKTDLFDMSMEEISEMEFKIKEFFDRSIIDDFNGTLLKILEDCKFENYSNAYFTPSDFDVVVNGKTKEAYGKGYRAFLNTIVSLALKEYLSAKGRYSPQLLIIDSPILSLKEKGSEKASESMKSALFQYMLDHQDHGQTIIIENDIPNLDYSNANVIPFTKEENNGRYGFLHGVRS